MGIRSAGSDAEVRTDHANDELHPLTGLQVDLVSGDLGPIANLCGVSVCTRRKTDEAGFAVASGDCSASGQRVVQRLKRYRDVREQSTGTVLDQEDDARASRRKRSRPRRSRSLQCSLRSRQLGRSRIARPCSGVQLEDEAPGAWLRGGAGVTRCGAWLGPGTHYFGLFLGLQQLAWTVSR